MNLNPNDINFPAQLRAARKAANITAVDMARRVGASKSAYNNWEKHRDQAGASIPHSKYHKLIFAALDPNYEKPQKEEKLELKVDVDQEIRDTIEKLKRLTGAREIHIIG